MLPTQHDLGFNCLYYGSIRVPAQANPAQQYSCSMGKVKRQRMGVTKQKNMGQYDKCGPAGLFA